MPYATAPDSARIHYQTYGDEGPWVVLLMGLGASSHLWLDLPKSLARGEPRYRALTLDALGTGDSDALRRPRSFRAMAAHVISAMDAAGVDRAYVVGLSMGGMVAQHLALRYPERVDGLVLMATTPGLVHGGLPTPRAIRSLLRVSVERSARTAEDIIGDLILAPSQRGRAREVLDTLKDGFRAAPTPTRAFLFQLVSCLFHATGNRLGRIRAPTVVVTGDHDIVMGRRASRVLAARIPGASLEVVPACGHGITFTHPETVGAALARLRAAS